MDFSHLEQGQPHNGLALPFQQSSTSPEPQDSKDNRHRRNYQACERCRERKVKCDLGPVDLPEKPPCRRCRRENKQCIFASERKKNKGEKRSGSEEDPDLSPNNNLPKRQKTALDDGRPPMPQYHPVDGNGYSVYDMPSMPVVNTPIHPSLRAHQAPRPIAQPGYFHNNGFEPVPPSHYRPKVKKDSDVNFTSDAAKETIGKDMNTTTIDNIGQLLYAANKLDRNLASDRDPELGKVDIRYLQGGPPPVAEEPMSADDRRYHDRALRAWTSMRFVRAGWFTAEEAMHYMAYFIANLQQMTPVNIQEYLSPRKQPELLIDEPVLAVSILAITSRHMRLRGHSHSTRAFLIHDSLWGYLRTQIQRLLWAQEQFGGGFTGAGASKLKESPGGQITWQGSLRTLGTVEALLLLTDWQPRALHFPPGNDEDYLLAADYKGLDTINGDHEHESAPSSAHDSTPYAGWLEPAWRSDKMSWMLLGIAQALSFELGVFDTSPADGGVTVNDGDRTRKIRIRKLVLIYVAQISGRIGIPSPLKLSDWEFGSTGATLPVDVMVNLWFDIANLMNQANRRIFPSRQFTKIITSSKEYKTLIGEFAPMLAAWKANFESIKTSISPTMQHVLLMEYEYARLYINSLGFQNVVEAFLRDNKLQTHASARAKVVAENKVYIDAFTEAAVHILDLVAEGLGKAHLRDAPVRTFLRNLSAMMFALKRLSLGTNEKLVRKILEKLERAVKLLGEEVVDDVHLSSQTSRLMHILVRNVKNTLIRVERAPNTSNAASRDQSRPQTPHHDGEQHQQHSLATTLPQVDSALSYGVYDPLAGIPAKQMMDLSDKQFIPPPNFNFNTNDYDISLMDDGNIDHSVISGEGGDWFAADMGNLWHSPTAQADQGAHSIGPTVGNRDYLELVHGNAGHQMQYPMESPTAFHNFQQW